MNIYYALFQAINGLPPVWKPHSTVGFFYTAFGGETVGVKLEALVGCTINDCYGI